jgi:hypothetical protein
MEDLLDVFDLFEAQPEGTMWRGAVNGRETASSKLAELSAKSGKPVVGSGKGATLRRLDLSVALRFL